MPSLGLKSLGLKRLTLGSVSKSAGAPKRIIVDGVFYEILLGADGTKLIGADGKFLYGRIS